MPLVIRRTDCKCISMYLLWESIDCRSSITDDCVTLLERNSGYDVKQKILYARDVVQVYSESYCFGITANGTLLFHSK